MLSGRPTRVTIYLIIQTRTLLRVKWDTFNNYARTTGITWNYLGKLESMANLITRGFEIFNYWF